MKICIHTNQLDGRGTGKTPRDYGIALRDILGHEVCYLTSGRSRNEGAVVIAQQFPVFTYDGHIDNSASDVLQTQIESVVEREKIDFIHMIKFGVNDGITPRNCKSGVHYVFDGNHPHGNVYAAVSENLARKYGQINYVPHIVLKKDATEDWRKRFAIPENALVIGRHGGRDTFDLDFVHRAVSKILDKRSDVYFLFLSTNKFIEHERAIFIDWIQDESEVYNFIHSCDIMLHGRWIGETFGLAVAEFSACNKPVMTWKGPEHNSGTYDTAHIDQLQGKAILYSTEEEIVSYFTHISKSDLSNQNWDTMTSVFTPFSVINQYQKIFL